MVSRRLSHYVVLEQIGAGGMGVVHRARDERLERDVALKVLPADTLADEAARRRFRKEALALSRLNHPNIGTVFDFDSQDGVDFIVMELVPGVTLAERLRAGAIPEPEMSRIGEQLAEGLSEAHAQGVVHRDIKPANVRITPEGRVKLLDFGLAQATRASLETVSTESMTADGVAVGTIPYMSPEQLRGERVDARSDIFSLGAVLYEMATGSRPFPEQSHARLIAAILTETPRAPRHVREDLTPEAERIILRCLEKNREHRYGSAAELATDLRRLTRPGAPAVRRPVSRVLVRRVALGLAAVFVIAAVVALVALDMGGVRGRLFRHAGGALVPSLAVLPLENLSGDASEDFFTDGITEEITARLAQVGALKVISRTSAMQYKGTRKGPRQIAKELGVRMLMEGTVRRSGDRVRISAELIEAASQRSVWAETFDRSLKDVFAVQSEIARLIVEQLQARLTPTERLRLARSLPLDPEAHTAYLKGLYEWNKRTIPSIRRAVGFFRQSIAIDPTNALPYAGLATCYAILPAYDPLHSREALHNCRVAALKALELDSTLAEPHAVLAGVLSESDWDQRGAEAQYRKAIELNPNYASAHQWYGDFLSGMGRHEEAIAEVKRARELDPLSLIINTEVGGVLGRAGQYDLAIETLRTTINMDPSFARAHETLGFVYVCAGDYIAATWEYQMQDSLLGLKSPAEAAAWYEPLRGAFREAGVDGYYRQLLKQRLGLAKQGARAPAIKIAVPYARLGQVDSAFAWLDRACAERDPLVLRIKVEPHWDSLRSDPRYAALLNRIGLPL